MTPLRLTSLLAPGRAHKGKRLRVGDVEGVIEHVDRFANGVLDAVVVRDDAGKEHQIDGAREGVVLGVADA